MVNSFLVKPLVILFAPSLLPPFLLLPHSFPLTEFAIYPLKTVGLCFHVPLGTVSSF
jgi:hypothetical protein